MKFPALKMSNSSFFTSRQMSKCLRLPTCCLGSDRRRTHPWKVHRTFLSSRSGAFLCTLALQASRGRKFFTQFTNDLNEKFCHIACKHCMQKPVNLLSITHLVHRLQAWNIRATQYRQKLANKLVSQYCFCKPCGNRSLASQGAYSRESVSCATHAPRQEN